MLAALSFIVGVLGICVVAPEARAAEDALVLPKGIFRARIVGVQTGEISERYNSNGTLEPFTYSLNRSVTVEDFLAKEPKLGNLVNALNALQPNLGNTLMNSNLYTESALNQRIVMPALEYGITSKVTFGIRLPIVTRDSRNSFRAESVNNAGAIANKMGALSPDLSAGLLSVDGMSLDTQFFANSLFTSKGYEAPHNFVKTEIGDLESGFKYRFYENRDKSYALATQWGVRLPTGSAPSLTHVFDKGSGAGSYATALSLFQDVTVAKGLVLGSMAKGWYFLADTRERAVPRDADDALPSLLDEDGQVQATTRQPGMQIDAELALTYSFYRDIYSIYAAYQYSAHGEDRFDGPGDLYYDGLSRDTEWTRSAIEAGASISTIAWYRAKKFPVPGKINLIYSNTLAGTNTPLTSFFRTDLIVYF